MATYTIYFHGVASVEADTEEEAKKLFYNDEEDYSEYEIDKCEGGITMLGKLTDILSEYFSTETLTPTDFDKCTRETFEDIARHLIANGVTVLQWNNTSELIPNEAEHGHRVLAVDSDTGTVDAHLTSGVINHPYWYPKWAPIPKCPK